jgi:hypothetical protein
MRRLSPIIPAKKRMRFRKGTTMAAFLRGGVITGIWILATGLWVDTPNIWIDTAIWFDGPAEAWILADGTWSDAGTWLDSALWIDT